MNHGLDVHRKPYLAHVRRNEDGSFAIHELEEHVRAVGNLASAGAANRVRDEILRNRQIERASEMSHWFQSSGNLAVPCGLVDGGRGTRINRSESPDDGGKKPKDGE